jgi:hypothetical protein
LTTRPPLDKPLLTICSILMLTICSLLIVPLLLAAWAIFGSSTATEATEKNTRALHIERLKKEESELRDEIMAINENFRNGNAEIAVARAREVISKMIATRGKHNGFPGIDPRDFATMCSSYVNHIGAASEAKKFVGQLLDGSLRAGRKQFSLQDLSISGTIFDELTSWVEENERAAKKKTEQEQILAERKKADERREHEAQKLAEDSQKRKSEIEFQFSMWDGSHKKLVKYIKNSMHDPNSFEHVSTSYVDRGLTLGIVMKFRGKNAFGQLVLNEVAAIVDSEDGDVISVGKN